MTSGEGARRDSEAARKEASRAPVPPVHEGVAPADAVEATEAADAVVRLLGPPTLRRLDVAANTGIPPEQTRRFWHALGFAASPSEDDMLYTTADQEAIQRTVAILRSGKIDENLGLAITRAIARSLDRLASWQTSLVMESLLRSQPGASQQPERSERLDGPRSAGPTGSASAEADGPRGAMTGSDLPIDLAGALALDREIDEHLWHQRLPPDASRQAGELLMGMVDDIEPLIIYAWRRHLAATIGRLMTNAEVIEDDGAQLAIGFADMVGFTTLVRRLSERQLAQLVQHFEEVAAEIVSEQGGQIVKMLGDEVVFTADDPQAAGSIALELLERVAGDPSMPQLRIGLAFGPVLRHLGDVFGTTVNRASRLTGVARPHTVVVDDRTATYLRDMPGFAMNRLPPRALRGLGMTVVWHLGREDRGKPSESGALDEPAERPGRES
ncbi:adenylate/guanylate cyclase domain-containing protein [Piscicoccus intestinalis]|uniref:adenylate/guanylate cyclase domain-containing protein n=1 Tax=Piscicoccus intestinalis TaxID=746033 RepID=UPI00083962EA|nr:adenylate/guanylate cyclase domain-containing protein [Piscicoccus intestinalis]